MKLLAALLAVASTILLQTSAAPSWSTDKPRVVCYFGSWAVYRYGHAKISADDIQPELCTHFIYTFVGLDPATNSVVLLDAWNDVGDEWKKGLLQTLRDKSQARGTKFMVAIGGWNEGSEKYSQVVGDPSRRKVLVDSIVKFCKDYNLDGFDLDWEYPAQRGGVPTDRKAFTDFTAELKQIFKAKGWILSAAVGANALTVGESYNGSAVSENLDMINVMAYDLHGSWDDKTGHNAPLYARKSDYPNDAHLSIDGAIKGWLSIGADPKKLNLGLASYGRSFTLRDPNQNGIGAPAGGIAPAGWTNEVGFVGYDEICYKTGSVYKTAWDDEQQVPYAWSGRNWVGFDDITSIRIKTCYAKSANLGGVMLWTVETDDFRGNCGYGKYPLLQSMRSALADPSCGGSGVTELPTSEEPQTETPQTEAPTDYPTTGGETEPPTDPPITPRTEEPQTEAPTSEVPQTEAPTDSPIPEETSAPPVPDITEAPVVPTPEPQPTEETPVVPPENEDDASSDIEWTPQCKNVGEYIKDRSDCSSFWACTPGVDGTPTPVKMQCATGTNYDASARICQHRAIVKC